MQLITLVITSNLYAINKAILHFVIDLFIQNATMLLTLFDI